MSPFQPEDGRQFLQIEAHCRQGFNGPVTRLLNEGFQGLPVPDIRGRNLREFGEVSGFIFRGAHIVVVATDQNEHLAGQRGMTAFDGVAVSGIHVLVGRRVVPRVLDEDFLFAISY